MATTPAWTPLFAMASAVVTDISLGWLPLRLPDTQKRLWAWVAYDPDYRRQIILLTNVPLISTEIAEQVYTQWRCRPRIEHTYRFDQEQGLNVEAMRVQTVERMRRVFVLVLLALCLSTTSPRPGRTKPSAGYAAWGQTRPEYRCRRPLHPACRHQCGFGGCCYDSLRPPSSFPQTQGDLWVITTLPPLTA